MTRAKAVRELIALLHAGEQLGAGSPSAELWAFLREIEATPVNTSLTRRNRPSTPRTGVTNPRRRPEAGVSKTIEELATKLRSAFESDAGFEALIRTPELQALTKPNVVTLFNKVFGTQRTFPKSTSKPDLLNELRRERIKRVRARA